MELGDSVIGRLGIPDQVWDGVGGTGVQGIEEDSAFSVCLVDALNYVIQQHEQVVQATTCS